jgi:mRNA interferase MazF
MLPDPKRGEIWMIGLEPIVGQEIHSHGYTRPCVVISSDALRKRRLRTVVPITTWQEKFDNDPLQIFLEAHASNGLEKDSSADSTQVRTVALERFDTLKGIVTEEELEAMVLAVGLVIQHP